MCQSSFAQQEAGVNVRKSKRSELEMKKNVFLAFLSLCFFPRQVFADCARSFF